MQISTFKALQSRNYRLYVYGQSVSLIGTWMQRTAVSWVVYSLTHSKLMLGLTMFAGLFPSFLLSFVGGVVTDRYNRYQVLLATQIASMVQAVLLTALVYFNIHTVVGIIILSGVLGIINAFDVPARQAMVYDMVDDKADLPNAIALNSSMVNLTRLIGPVIAGFVLEKLGDDVCFGLNALSFIAVIASLLLMKLPPAKPSQHKKNALNQLTDGFAYLKQVPEIKFILMMLALASLFVQPFNTLITVYAKDIFHGTAGTFGVIDSFIGLGALSCAVFLASLKTGHNLRKILAYSTLVYGVGLVLFAHQQMYWLALVLAVPVGFGMMSQITISNTLIQTTVAPEMRGRVISFYAVAFFGMMPLGSLLMGWLAQRIGAQNTVLAEGIIGLLLGLWHLSYVKRMEKAPLPKLAEEEAALV